MKSKAMIRSVKIFALLGLCLCHKSPSFADGKRELSIKAGDYLREDYVSIIKATYSPSAAASALSAQLSSIKAKSIEDGIELMFGYNFHEGGAALQVRKSGEVVVKWGGGDDFSSPAVLVNPDNSLSISIGGSRFKFIYVGDEERFVAKHTIQGKYVSESGDSYIFGDDGVAFWGTKKFKYAVGLDYIERWKERDYFYDLENSDLFEFEFKNGTLNIYRTSGEMSRIVELTPFVKLKKVE